MKFNRSALILMSALFLNFGIQAMEGDKNPPVLPWPLIMPLIAPLQPNIINYHNGQAPLAARMYELLKYIQGRQTTLLPIYIECIHDICIDTSKIDGKPLLVCFLDALDQWRKDNTDYKQDEFDVYIAELLREDERFNQYYKQRRIAEGEAIQKTNKSRKRQKNTELDDEPFKGYPDPDALLRVITRSTVISVEKKKFAITLSEAQLHDFWKKISSINKIAFSKRGESKQRIIVISEELNRLQKRAGQANQKKYKQANDDEEVILSSDEPFTMVSPEGTKI